MLHILLILLVSFNVASHSPELEGLAFSILEGKVIDENGAAVVLGNALLLSPQDSSLIHGEVFYDGILHLPGITAGVYLITGNGIRFRRPLRHHTHSG